MQGVAEVGDRVARLHLHGIWTGLWFRSEVAAAGLVSALAGWYVAEHGECAVLLDSVAIVDLEAALVFPGRCSGRQHGLRNDIGAGGEVPHSLALCGRPRCCSLARYVHICSWSQLNCRDTLHLAS